MDRDTDGWFEECLQCGHRKEIRELKNQLVPVRVRQFPAEDWSKHKND